MFAGIQAILGIQGSVRGAMLRILELMEAILEIQALVREAMLRMLELIEAWTIASTKLLPSLLKWPQCSPKLMEYPSHMWCIS